MFRRVRERIPNAALLMSSRRMLAADSKLLGGWSDLDRPIPPSEIKTYFNLLDVDLAQEKTLGTEFAFQLKIVEYSACRNCRRHSAPYLGTVAVAECVSD